MHINTDSLFVDTCLRVGMELKMINRKEVTSLAHAGSLIKDIERELMIVATRKNAIAAEKKRVPKPITNKRELFQTQNLSKQYQSDFSGLTSSQYKVLMN